MRTLLLILAVAVLFGGGGFGAGYLLFAEPSAAGDEAAENGAATPPAHGDAKGGSIFAPPVFVNIGPINVPVLGEDRVEQFVTLVVALEVSDPFTAERVREQGPRLTDAYLQELYGGIASGQMMAQGLLDLPTVKERLAKATTRVVGRDKVRDVLVQVVNQRPL